MASFDWIGRMGENRNWLQRHSIELTLLGVFLFLIGLGIIIGKFVL